MKIYNLGSLNIDYVYNVDHFVTAGETLSSKNMKIFPGGKGLNQSVAFARAGAKVIHGAIIGDNGEMLLNVLSEAGVDVSRIQNKNGSCGHTIIQVDKKGQNCILLYPGTNYCFDREYIENFLFDAKENDILLLQNEINCLDIIFEIAHSKKMQIAFNPSPFQDSIKELPLHFVKWFFCNEIEGKALFGNSNPEKQADEFVKRFQHSNLILTLGKEGSIFKNAHTCIKQPIYKANAVDTTAAGDTFTGYFLATLIEKNDVALSLDIASKASAITVSRPGASSSIPWLKEVYDN